MSGLAALPGVLLWHVRRGLADRRVRRRLAAAPASPGTGALRRHLERPVRPLVRVPIDGARFCVFDTETTGLDPRRDRLLSIGAIAVHVDGRTIRLDVADAFERTVIAESVGGASAATVHGMVRRDVTGDAGARDEAEAVCDFLDWVADGILVAHHLAFDRRVIDAALARIGPVRVRSEGIDTVFTARRLDEGPLARHRAAAAGHGGGGTGSSGGDRRYGLDALCARFGIEVSERHHASGDALATAELLMHLLHLARHRGARTVADLA